MKVKDQAFIVAPFSLTRLELDAIVHPRYCVPTSFILVHVQQSMVLDVLKMHAESAPVRYVTRSAHASPSYTSSTMDIRVSKSTLGHNFLWQVPLQVLFHWNNYSCYPLAHTDVMLDSHLECRSPIYTLRPTPGVCSAQRLQVKRKSGRLGACTIG
jgi:hypothetical protein